MLRHEAAGDAAAAAAAGGGGGGGGAGGFVHPRDHRIPLSSHLPLYLPGKIIHVVRNHPPGAEYVATAAFSRPVLEPRGGNCWPNAQIRLGLLG